MPVPPRPTITAPCTCIWASLAAQTALEDDERTADEPVRAETDDHHHRHPQERTLFRRVRDALPQPLSSAIPDAGPRHGGESNEPEEVVSGSQGQVTREAGDATSHSDKENLPPAISVRQPFSNARSLPKRPDEVVPGGNGSEREPGGYMVTANKNKDTSVTIPTRQHANDARKLSKEDALQRRGGSLALKSRPDAFIRAFKSRISQSSENKLGDLISYREDLFNTLVALIPTASGANAPRGIHQPLIRPLPSTPLCQTCMLNLAHELYVSPAVKSPYIRAHSTAAYLALIDDATAALDADACLERVTHSQLNSIIRVELAVVEWRISLKLARYHKRTGFLDMFPVRLGEFAQFVVDDRHPVQPDGFLSKAGKTIKKAVGWSSAPAPASKQGAETAVEDAAV
ncbi:hypothetical protein HDU87_007657 [Geranomyces variabilis]|uniref:Uncharacterized protein n=1 Tax=Geranomyces variabilis TaxID=109894 RepID=A0AAD5XPS2_9FUNG|nr:hypothetical protein HDU87_007657 [Geranomyces variabilis]